MSALLWIIFFQSSHINPRYKDIWLWNGSINLIKKAKFVHFKPWYKSYSNSSQISSQIPKITYFLMQMESLKKLLKGKKKKTLMRLATFETKHLALSLWLVVRAGGLDKQWLSTPVWLQLDQCLNGMWWHHGGAAKLDPCSGSILLIVAELEVDAITCRKAGSSTVLQLVT